MSKQMTRTKKKVVKGSKRRRLVRGVDWHAWAWRTTEFDKDGFAHFAEPARPRLVERRPTPTGKWVRVKFVEVEP